MEAQDEILPSALQLIFKERDLQEQMLFTEFVSNKCIALQTELEQANKLAANQLVIIDSIKKLANSWKFRCLAQEIDIEILETRLLLLKCH